MGADLQHIFSFILPLGILSTSAWPGIVIALVYLILILAGQGAGVVLALKMPSLHPENVGTVPMPIRLTIIIPARNEAGDIGHILDDLLHQDLTWNGGGSMEVIVVDGGSADDTRQIAQQHPLKPIVLEEPPLPPGWVGKSWACHTGAMAASGEAFLFLDADVRLSREAVRAAVAEMVRDKVDLVTFAARIVMVGFWEKVVLPIYTQFVLTYFMPPLVNRPTSKKAMANGQFLLVTRKRYETVGGHSAIRGFVLEDVRLAEKVKESGGAIRVLWTPRLVSTRMYADRREMFEGLSKNIFGTHFSLLRQTGFIAAISLLFLSPYVVLVLSLQYGSLLWLVVSLGAISVTLLKQAAFQHAISAPIGYAFLYPLGCAFYLWLLLHSIRVGLGSRSVTWKGRSYAVGHERTGMSWENSR